SIIELTAAQQANQRHRRLLRARRQRPRGCAAEQRDELAPLHSITSSARASSVGGNVMPRTLAVIRLMVSSTFTACWPGRSAGLSPLRAVPTSVPARRSASTLLAP